MSDADDPKPTPLEYETPPPDAGPAQAGEVVSQALLIAIAAWFVLTLVVCGSGSIRLEGSAPPKSRWILPVVVMLALAGVAASVYASNRRDPRRSRREFVLALLLGVGLAVLVHGACFVVSVIN